MLENLAILGFFQYLSPTIQFVLSITVLGEPIDSGKLAGFFWIWAGLLLFSGESIWRWWQGRKARALLIPQEKDHALGFSKLGVKP